MNSRDVEREHLFIGLLSLEKAEKILGEGESLGVAALEAERTALAGLYRQFELDPAALRRRVRAGLVPDGQKLERRVVHRSAATKAVFVRAEEQAGNRGLVSCSHLLVALLDNPGPVIVDALEAARVDVEALADAARAGTASSDQAAVRPVTSPSVGAGDTPYLDRYGRDLTKEAAAGRLRPVIGRRKEILAVLQTLARSSKNNPVLVGDAGVGKTAVVEAIAQRGAQGKDAEILGGRRIVELSLGGLMGGTRYRGDFEERVTKVLAEVNSHPEVILFIDELHNLMGAGQGEGQVMDAANMLKPALARGELRCIGATTVEEYRRHIEADAALERRFERITVEEPTREETFEILSGLRESWERHHQVAISDAALQAAVDLSVRFDIDHRLPDKAIDLVDKAGARARIPMLSMTAASAQSRGLMASSQVSDVTIAQVLADKVGVALEVIAAYLGRGLTPQLAGLEAALNRRIVAQDEAVRRVCQRLLVTQAGLGERRGPLGVFLFLGPSGVGKTYLAKLLAESLRGSADELLRLDMSEFMEEHSAAKLVGSPPGYVGHGEEGQLTGRLRTRPHSVVLLDEVEKAHPRVFDLFLQVFDEGRITDAKGTVVDARNAIFILTSNISSQREHAPGFVAMGAKDEGNPIPEGLESFFRKEFLNRIDEIIVFSALRREDLKEIVGLQFAEIARRAKERYGLTLELGDDVCRLVVEEAWLAKQGARGLERVLDQRLVLPLTRHLLSRDPGVGGCLAFVVADGHIGLRDTAPPTH